jgi:hypothetical protein
MQVIVIGGEGIGHLSVAHLNSLAAGIRELGLAADDTCLHVHYLGNSLREVQFEPVHVQALEMPDFPAMSHEFTIKDILCEHDMRGLLSIFDRPELHIEPMELRDLRALVEVEPTHRIEPPRFRGYMKRASRKRWL